MDNSQFEMFSVARPQSLEQTNMNWEIENHLLYLPIFGFHKPGSPNSRFKQVREFQMNTTNGEVVVRNIVVAAGSRIVTNGKNPPTEISEHLPVGFDMIVLYALMSLWDEQGRNPDGSLEFSLSNLCRKLDLSVRSGKNFSRLKDSIFRLESVTIHIDQAFYSVESRKHISTKIGLLERGVHFVEIPSKPNSSIYRIRLGEQLVKNLTANFSSSINKELLLRLSSGFAQRILSLAVLRRRTLEREGVLVFTLPELAQLLPMAETKYESQMIKRLTPSINELNEKKVLRCEIVKVNGETVLSVSQILDEKDSFKGASRMNEFFSMFRDTRGKSIESVLQLSQETIEQFIQQHAEKEMIYLDRLYGRPFLVLDVIAHQIMSGYKVDDLSGLMSHLIRPSSKIDFRSDYEPFDIRFEKKQKSKAAETALAQRLEIEKKESEAKAESLRIAENAVDRLKEEDLRDYLKEIYSASEENQFIKGRISRYLSGEDLELSPMVKSLVSAKIRDQIATGSFRKELK